jgi:hypothetical protein
MNDMQKKLLSLVKSNGLSKTFVLIGGSDNLIDIMGESINQCFNKNNLIDYIMETVKMSGEDVIDINPPIREIFQDGTHYDIHSLHSHYVTDITEGVKDYPMTVLSYPYHEVSKKTLIKIFNSIRKL